MIRHVVLALSLFGFSAAYAETVFVTQVTNAEAEVLLADSFNRTLYVFDKDVGQAVPTCTADCAETWPPYTISREEAATLTAPLAAVARANKQLQLTYMGRPLYTFAFERTKGADLGDGLGGVWHYVEVKAEKK